MEDFLADMVEYAPNGVVFHSDTEFEIDESYIVHRLVRDLAMVGEYDETGINHTLRSVDTQWQYDIHIDKYKATVNDNVVWSGA